ncbi:MAG TPA: rhodanese-like domain-containing protein [Candidatus Babeliaceae bacterium]|nr:rhodanese-like domain-containing protein [Candidatus Babeliaceae bacterium]
MLGKKEKLLKYIAIIILIVLPGCWFDKKSDESKQKVSTEASSLKVINLLSKELVDDATIVGSINIPMDKLEAEVKNWNRETPIVVYCANYACTSSAQAAKKLMKMGFKNVKAYEGGTAEWYQLGKTNPDYRIKGPAQQSYLSLELPKSPIEHSGIEVITAEELLKSMRDAGL